MPFCPDIDETHDMLMALLPRGRAWQTHDSTIDRASSKLQSFIYSIAEQFQAIEDDLCQAFDELFCSTADINLDLWLDDYALPDDCDPFGDNICAKVAAIGGTTLEYYENIATELGWAADMRWLKGDDAEFPGVVSTLFISIDSAASTAAWDVTTFANWTIGESRLGDPDTTTLACALDRIIPAHCAISYEVV